MRYRSEKVNPYVDCEVYVTAPDKISDAGSADYSVVFKTNVASIEKSMIIENATSIGSGNIRAVTQLLREISTHDYKNIVIYFPSDHVVNTYNGLTRIIQSRKVESSKIKNELKELYATKLETEQKQYFSMRRKPNLLGGYIECGRGHQT